MWVRLFDRRLRESTSELTCLELLETLTVDLMRRAMVDLGELLLNSDAMGRSVKGASVISSTVHGHMRASMTTSQPQVVAEFRPRKAKGCRGGTHSPLFFLWQPSQKQVRSSPKLRTYEVPLPPPPSYF